MAVQMQKRLAGALFLDTLWDLLLNSVLLLLPCPLFTENALSASARVSGRWGGSYPSSKAITASSSASSSHAATAPFLSGARRLAAQVSFNHEKRRGWEKPVLEDINAQRASAGLPAVDKLTIQVSC